MLSKIFDCPPKLHDIVLESSERPIAVKAEEAPDSPGYMVMV